MSNADIVARGFKGFPECDVCQCYPECRCDCPEHLQCVQRMPEYAERVFGPDLATWPADLRKVWHERGWETLDSRHARWLAAQPAEQPKRKLRWWERWWRW